MHDYQTASGLVTWDATLPCPDCGLDNVIGISLVLQGFGHNHTKYFCRSWVKPPDDPEVGRPCGWWGWSVPGWDDAEAGGEMTREEEDD